jgi:pyruvate kinase
MNSVRKTKIVCTIGPSSENPEKMAELAGAGMDIMRLNFSHGNFEEHQKRVDVIREIMKKTNKKISILQDLSGPKIRIGTLKEKMIILKEGQTFMLRTAECEGDESGVYINYPNLPKEVEVGGFVMLQDGTKRLEVVEIKGDDIVTKVIVGGTLVSHSGVNVPSTNLKMSSLTEKDKKDIEFGIKNEVDFMALSFVHTAGDIEELRNVLESKGSKAKIVAKIETPKAVKNIDEIIKASDSIMIARGDLGIEIPAEEVPLVQKMIIKKCNSVGKFVITATQMLESMVKSPVPTRAEVSDVANAIIDGTDAIMLSEETALGDYPVESLKEMVSIALRTEEGICTGKIDLKYD